MEILIAPVQMQCLFDKVGHSDPKQAVFCREPPPAVLWHPGECAKLRGWCRAPYPWSQGAGRRSKASMQRAPGNSPLKNQKMTWTLRMSSSGLRVCLRTKPVEKIAGAPGFAHHIAGPGDEVRRTCPAVVVGFPPCGLQRPSVVVGRS